MAMSMNPNRSLIAVLCYLTITLGCRGDGPLPEFAYRDYRGCGDRVATTWNQESTEVLTIEVDRSRLVLAPSTVTTFDLGQPRDGLRVRVGVYASGEHDWIWRDVKQPRAQPPQTWMAAAGRLSVSLGARSGESGEYSLTVVLIDARFRGPDGRMVEMTQPVRFTTTAGTGPGG